MIAVDNGGVKPKIDFGHQFWITKGSVMRQLKWSSNQTGAINGKVGFLTLFTIAYYPERGYFLVPKLPGLNKTIPISSEEEGKYQAGIIYKRYVNYLLGGEW
jgi:hypothetical protein